MCDIKTNSICPIGWTLTTYCNYMVGYYAIWCCFLLHVIEKIKHAVLHNIIAEHKTL